MRIHSLQHADSDGPGSLQSAVAALGHSLSGTRLYAGQPLPKLADFDALVVLGGPMNIYEHAAFPWLPVEKQLIGECLAAARPILGICLGAQLLADALGGRVQRAAERERGFWPVHKSAAGRASPLLADLSDPFMAFHWHEDEIWLPDGDCAGGMVSLATSAGCAQQAFTACDGRAFGVQFHPEITAAAAQEWFEGDDWPATRFVQTRAAVLENQQAFAGSAVLMAALAGRFFSQFSN